MDFMKSFRGFMTRALIDTDKEKAEYKMWNRGRGR